VFEYNAPSEMREVNRVSAETKNSMYFSPCKKTTFTQLLNSKGKMQKIGLVVCILLVVALIACAADEIHQREPLPYDEES
jgi:hypothetical protein